MNKIQTDNSYLEVCLSNLIGVDINTINEDEINQNGVNNLQIILNNIWSELNKENTKDGIVVKLPNTQKISLPRAYPLPIKKEKTKWEKFAELKGIRKRKRSRMVYDPITDNFVPRWGKNSIKKIQKKYKEAIIEVKNNLDDSADPREIINKKKQIMTNKQKLRELKNKMKSDNIKLSNNNNIPLGIGNLSDTNIKRNKHEISELFDRVSLSTASYGRKDKLIDNKDPNNSKIKKVKKNIIDIKDESNKYKNIYNKIFNNN